MFLELSMSGFNDSIVELIITFVLDENNLEDAEISMQNYVCEFQLHLKAFEHYL